VPPALATLFGLHETGDGVFSPREVRHVRQAAIWPSHPPHAGTSRIGHHFGPPRTQVASASVRSTPSSNRSIARTGTRNSRPTLIVGISPRSAALYELSRLRSKYFFPASGTDIVRGASPVDFVIFPAPVSAKNDLQNTIYVLDRFDAI
jgi:hypothetical protein